jgi:DNA/RNA-binding domain of Phe-tRNA-synthetase-like protein
VFEPLTIQAEADVRDIVRPVATIVRPVTVRDREEALDAALVEAAVGLRSADLSPWAGDVRAMYRRTGVDPTKTRPSSEALVRRVKRGEPLPHVNTIVDIINWCSAESGLPFGLYDGAQVRGAVVIRLGREEEAYAGIRKDLVHLAGRLTLADDDGPFGNPTSDSARTMVTLATTSAMVVIFAPASIAADGPRSVLARTCERLGQFRVAS